MRCFFAIAGICYMCEYFYACGVKAVYMQITWSFLLPLNFINRFDFYATVYGILVWYLNFLLLDSSGADWLSFYVYFKLFNGAPVVYWSTI